MQFVSHLFAENVWPLIWVIALAELILLIAVVGLGRGKLLVWMGVLAFVAVFLVLLEWLLVTDRERVDGIVDQVAQAVRREDIEGVLEHLAPECRFGSHNREGIRHMAAAVLREVEIERVTLSDRKTQVFPERGEATTQFLAVARGRQSTVEFGPYAARWTLTLNQGPAGQWQIVNIEQLQAFGDQHPSPPARRP